MKQTMKSCILEQPDTIRRVCQNAEKVCDSVYSIVGKGPFDKIYLIGSGTSLMQQLRQNMHLQNGSMQRFRCLPHLIFCITILIID